MLPVRPQSAQLPSGPSSAARIRALQNRESRVFLKLPQPPPSPRQVASIRGPLPLPPVSDIVADRMSTTELKRVCLLASRESKWTAIAEADAEIQRVEAAIEREAKLKLQREWREALDAQRQAKELEKQQQKADEAERQRALIESWTKEEAVVRSTLASRAAQRKDRLRHMLRESQLEHRERQQAAACEEEATRKFVQQQVEHEARHFAQQLASEKQQRQQQMQEAQMELRRLREINARNRVAQHRTDVELEAARVHREEALEEERRLEIARRHAAGAATAAAVASSEAVDRMRAMDDRIDKQRQQENARIEAAAQSKAHAREVKRALQRRAFEEQIRDKSHQEQARRRGEVEEGQKLISKDRTTAVQEAERLRQRHDLMQLQLRQSLEAQVRDRLRQRVIHAAQQ